MRKATPFHSLLLAGLALGATACGDSPNEPIVDEPTTAGPPAFDLPPTPSPRWAAGYLLATAPTTASYAPTAQYAYNQSGGTMNITKIAGYTGRYTVTFRGLSAAIGAKSTLQVSGFGPTATHCKPMTGTLILDKVEVRCFTGTGNPMNAQFSIAVLRPAATRGFAFANQPTANGYAPLGSGSYNPTGSIKVNRVSTGYYEVVFTNLGTKTATHGGNVQVTAVGGGKATCRISWPWYGETNMSVPVSCYLPGGVPVDNKFTVLFQLPAAHLAYTWSDRLSESYTPTVYYSWGNTKGTVRIDRGSVGNYLVTWSGTDQDILEGGNPQVIAQGEYESGFCTVAGVTAESVGVRCFTYNGVPADSRFTVLRGS